MSLASWKRRLRPRPIIQQLEIRDLAARALAFQQRLTAARKKLPPLDPGWYPWDSFGALTHLDRLLTGRHRFLEPLIGDLPVLDLGCGDGDLAFLFESLGCRVCAIDNPPTNYNRMAGVEALKIALDSSVRIEPLDLDGRFRLPLDRCGLALCLGILYHLKNPYGVLETLAACSNYCLLSTAITRFAPDQATEVNHLPVAFLAGREGLRGDETNYWVFSETGLRTLADRCGWEVCDWLVVDDEASVLWNTQRDERVFCLLRSRTFDLRPVTQPVDGWHILENGAWRWTKRRFSIVVVPGAQRLTLKLTVPPNLELPLTLTARTAGALLATHTLTQPGDYECAQQIPPGAEVLVEFQLDRALPPDATDSRERAIIVRAIELG
jgi:SAM-dependent methyltransferase